MVSADVDRLVATHAARLRRSKMEAGQGGPFGAVVVCLGHVLAEGWTTATSAEDPIAHAEVVAIRRARAAVGDHTRVGATIHASCEPCPTSWVAIDWARMDRLRGANARHQAAAIGFDDSSLYGGMPKPPAGRILPTRHPPLADAEAAFSAWSAKTLGVSD